METSAVDASWRPTVTLLWRSLKTRPLCHEPWRSVEAEWYRLSPLKCKNHNSFLWISLLKQWSSLVIFVNRHEHVMWSRQNQSWSFKGSDRKETHETYFSRCQALLLLQQPSQIILFCLFHPNNLPAIDGRQATDVTMSEYGGSFLWKKTENKR